MSLLVLDGVTKRFARGGRRRRERLALHDASLELRAGELVSVWGQRRSGRTTLLRVAGGVVAPTCGAVRFDGRDLRERSMLGVPGGIGYCQREFSSVIGEAVVEHVAAPLLGGRRTTAEAEAAAYRALRRVGATGCAELEPDELDHGETIRVAIARALVSGPRLLLIDEPAVGLAPTASGAGALYRLLESLAHDDGIAVLTTVDEASGLCGADRALTIDAGELHGQLTPPAPVAAVFELDARRARPSA
ncbi:ATP-binding cassette domain-containing protein [Conexibacter arvalis]|uniref:ABC-type multidrug transport system ATPase subunit n=1 Tax=Conexibacter arvalis TaxID=912552 RepID=A0A840II36_9ACTN|nr:ATP-binding cassette domain-containing protein [Conexibacter arvalis]MBB4663833.1 ABC-type multidrug transport system ATPase subunit [Conexibacter arvalis]